MRHVWLGLVLSSVQANVLPRPSHVEVPGEAREALASVDPLQFSVNYSQSACYYVSLLRYPDGRHYHTRFGWGSEGQDKVPLQALINRALSRESELSRTSQKYRASSAHSEKLFECCGLSSDDVKKISERRDLLLEENAVNESDARITGNCAGNANYIFAGMGAAKLPSLWSMTSQNYNALIGKAKGEREVAALDTLLESKVSEKSCSKLVDSPIVDASTLVSHAAQRALSENQKFLLWADGLNESHPWKENERQQLLEIFLADDPKIAERFRFRLEKEIQNALKVEMNSTETKKLGHLRDLLWLATPVEKTQAYLENLVKYLPRDQYQSQILDLLEVSDRRRAAAIRIFARKKLPFDPVTLEKINRAARQTAALDDFYFENKVPRDVVDTGRLRSQRLRIIEKGELRAKDMDSPYPETLQAFIAEDIKTGERRYVATWGRLNRKVEAGTQKLKVGDTYEVFLFPWLDSISTIGVADVDSLDDLEKSFALFPAAQ